MRVAFVTVGTTLFEDLVAAFDSGSAALRLLQEAGFDRVVVQHGNGPAPRVSDDGLVDCYRFKPSLHDDLERAALVISHAGAGSILEALGMGKPLLVVVNETLLHNHQSELADELAKQGYLVATSVHKLCDVLAAELLAADGRLRAPGILPPLPPASPALFGQLLNEEMGI